MTTKANPTSRQQVPASSSPCKPAFLVEIDDWTVREVLILAVAVLAARVLRRGVSLRSVGCALAGVGGHWLLTALHVLGR